MAGMYGGNPYEVQPYQLPNGNIVNLTNQQAQQLFGGQQQVNTPPQTVQTPSLPNAAQPSTPVAIGRFINSPDDIVPNEVPMDGRVSFFPLRDCSAIYAKQWDANGNIQTAKYVLSVETTGVDPDTVQGSPKMDEIVTKLNSIEQKLEKIEKFRPYYKKPYNKSKGQNKEDQQ